MGRPRQNELSYSSLASVPINLRGRLAQSPLKAEPICRAEELDKGIGRPSTVAESAKVQIGIPEDVHRICRNQSAADQLFADVHRLEQSAALVEPRVGSSGAPPEAPGIRRLVLVRLGLEIEG